MRDGSVYKHYAGRAKTLVNVDVLGIQDGVAVIRAKFSKLSWLRDRRYSFHKEGVCL